MKKIRRKTHEEFILEMEIKHPQIKVIGHYVNGKTKIKLECQKCGLIFSATPGSLYMGHGCPKCGGTMKKSHEQFLCEMKELHPNIDILSKYEANNRRIQLRCNTCGYEWSAVPNSLLRGKGCKKCAGTLRKTQEQYADEMSKLHPTIKVLGIYENNKKPVRCRCEVCGNEFDGIPHQMITRGDGCPFCCKTRLKTHDEFVKEMAIVAPDIIVLGEYKNSKEKVLCRCLRCGNDFLSKPNSMLFQGAGCPHCSRSIGERRVSNWLKLNNVEFIEQKRFLDCKDINPLPFDFYIPSKNMAIEFDGIQHYKPVAYFNGGHFEYTKRHDEIKNEFCLANGIKLLRIPYWDLENIDNILTKELAS